MARPESIHHVDHASNSLQFLKREERADGLTVFSVVPELGGLRTEDDRFAVREK